jgi:hypothetical protein
MNNNKNTLIIQSNTAKNFIFNEIKNRLIKANIEPNIGAKKPNIEIISRTLILSELIDHILQ